MLSQVNIIIRHEIHRKKKLNSNCSVTTDRFIVSWTTVDPFTLEEDKVKKK